MLRVYSFLEVFILAVVMPATLQQKEMGSLEIIADSSNRFAVDLYMGLKNKSGNILVSPICFHIALSLAYNGANGKTADEIAALLYLPSDKEQILEGHRALITNLQDSGLTMASKIFTADNISIKSEFQSVITNYYLSEIEEKDFLNDSKKAVDEINSWVENKTQNKIKSILSEGDVSALTQVILVNAIHFKADWAQQFDSARTHRAPFYVSADETVEVDMMVMQKGKFKFLFSDVLQAHIVEIPYKGHEFSMLIILPDSLTGLPEVEGKLATLNLAVELLRLEDEVLDLVLPKFKIEETVFLNENLQSLGMLSAFKEGSADFSGISSESLSISKVVQKVFVEVDEQGTEAAAVTASVLRKRRAVEPRKEIICNHPFGFMIVHHQTGSVLFASRVSNIPPPASSSPSHEEL